MDFLRACVLCAALCALIEAFPHQDMKEALLEKLGLDELPKIHKRDLENLVIPAHIRNKYLSMLKTQHSRRRRSLPSLAGILRGIPGNAGEDSLRFKIFIMQNVEGFLSEMFFTHRVNFVRNRSAKDFTHQTAFKKNNHI